MKFCSNCGTALTDGSRCLACSKEFGPAFTSVEEATRSPPRTRTRSWVRRTVWTVSVVGLAAVLFYSRVRISIAIDSTVHDYICDIKGAHDHDGTSSLLGSFLVDKVSHWSSRLVPGTTNAEKARALATKPDGEALPYEVWRNPYSYTGRAFLMRVSLVPTVFQDRVVASYSLGEFTQPAATEQEGLQFERSLSSSSAIFAVKGANADLHSWHGLWQFGEIVVDFKSSDPAVLNVTKDWIVRGEGVARGTNTVGGPIEVPRLEFLRYAGDEPDQMTSNQSIYPVTPPSKSNTSAVNCCAYALEVMRNPFKFKGARWAIYVDAIPVIDGDSYQRVPNLTKLKILGVSYNRSLSESLSMFNVLGSRRGSLYPLDVLGQIVVEVAAVSARDLDASKIWVIDCLGTTDLVNGFGVPIAVPLVRFVEYYDLAQDAGTQKDQPKPNQRSNDISQQLLQAIEDEDVDRAYDLLKRGANPNVREPNDFGDTALIEATWKRRSAEFVRLLLARGADVNAKNLAGSTALGWALSRASDDTVRLLIDAGAEMSNARKIGAGAGETSLITSASRATPTATTALIEKGAEVNASSTNGTTALITAAAGGHLETVKVLIENGADVNAKSRDGETALMFAAFEGHLEVVKVLLAHGANAGLKGLGGRTALSLATDHCKNDIPVRSLGACEVVTLLNQVNPPAEREGSARSPNVN